MRALPVPLLYIGTVLIWGTAWFGITLQLGTVPILVSVAWRFLAAACVLFGILWISGGRLVLPRRLWLRCVGIGVINFSVSYYLFYHATIYLPSGVVSIVYCLVIPLNLVSGLLVQKAPITPRAIAAAVIGIAGLVLVFWEDVSQLENSTGAAIGIGLALGATLVSSLSQALWVVARAQGVPLLTGLAWAMLSGAALTFAVAIALGLPLAPEASARYLGSFVFLVVFSSVLANIWYYQLLERIGLGAAAYGSLIYPVIALALSTMLEDYHWTPAAVAGVTLVLVGNALVLLKR